MKIWPTAGWTLRCWPASAPASSSKPRRQRLCLYRRRADRQQILRRRRRHRGAQRRYRAAERLQRRAAGDPRQRHLQENQRQVFRLRHVRRGAVINVPRRSPAEPAGWGGAFGRRGTPQRKRQCRQERQIRQNKDAGRQDARPARAGYFTSPIAFSFWTARGALWTDRHF